MYVNGKIRYSKTSFASQVLPAITIGAIVHIFLLLEDSVFDFVPLFLDR